MSKRDNPSAIKTGEYEYYFVFQNGRRLEGGIFSGNVHAWLIGNTRSFISQLSTKGKIEILHYKKVPYDLLKPITHNTGFPIENAPAGGRILTIDKLQ